MEISSCYKSESSMLYSRQRERFLQMHYINLLVAKSQVEWETCFALTFAMRKTNNSKQARMRGWDQDKGIEGLGWTRWNFLPFNILGEKMIPSQVLSRDGGWQIQNMIMKSIYHLQYEVRYLHLASTTDEVTWESCCYAPTWEDKYSKTNHKKQ